MYDRPCLIYAQMQRKTLVSGEYVEARSSIM